MQLIETKGNLNSKQITQIADRISEVQLLNGMIPWFEGGHADPWNHIECAMALDLAGRHGISEKAYGWLADVQLENGAWYQYYLSSFVEVDRLDANCVAYIATGVWHHYLHTKDEVFLEKMWGIVKPAIEFVLDLQTSRGEIIWARHSDGTPYSFALLTGSCSIYHSLNMAVKIAEEVDDPQPDWELAAETLGKVITSQPEAFAPKKRWAMDWYYPVLSGVITGDRALKHLQSKEDIFIQDQRGVKCVSDRPWFTAAETAECTMAYLNAGNLQKAKELFSFISAFRLEDGNYYTGFVYPTNKTEESSNSEIATFPDLEVTTYTAAAVLLADTALKQERILTDSLIPASI